MLFEIKKMMEDKSFNDKMNNHLNNLVGYSIIASNFNSGDYNIVYNVNELANIDIFDQELKEDNVMEEEKTFKMIIYMRGLTGSGKSQISKALRDYLNKNIGSGKATIVSKDDYRYTKLGYTYTPENEIFVTQKYKKRIRELINQKNVQMIILDNTHLDINKYLETRVLYENLNSCKIIEFIVDVEPYKILEKHQIYNVHYVPIKGVQRQYEEYENHKKQINTLKIKTLSIKRTNDCLIGEEKINIVCQFFNEFYKKLIMK